MKIAPEITCIGEVLVDFVSSTSGVSLTDAPGFIKLAGGASANVAVGLAKLGIRAAFVGKVGNDPFGRFLCGELARNCVDTSGVRFDKHRKTRLAFVSLTKSGERDFEFWEDHPADEHLGMSDVALGQVTRSKIVHISSFLFLAEPARSVALTVGQTVRRRGGCVAFDPNIRFSLWKSKTQARETSLEMVRSSNILRLNEVEARFLSRTHDLRNAARRLHSLGPSLVVVTMAERGCFAYTEKQASMVRGFNVPVLDTTGCGDGFLAGLLCGVLHANKDPATFSASDLSAICGFANAVGALTATRYGVFPALPTLAQVKRFLKESRR